MSKVVQICKFGEFLLRYQDTLHLQQVLHRLRVLGTIPDTVLLLQHQPVFTSGKRPDADNDFLVDKQSLVSMGIDVESVNRGGRVTYHGPGQWVLYPIVNVKELNMGVKAFVTGLEDAMMLTLAQNGLQSKPGTPEGYTGVFVEERKIGSVGITLQQRVTMHGISLNVDMDLQPYKFIVPCGIMDRGVTSMAAELKARQDMGDVGNELLRCFIEKMGYSRYRYLNPQGIVDENGEFKVQKEIDAEELRKLMEYEHFN